MRLLAYRDPLEVALFAGGYGSDSVPRLLARSGAPIVASDGAEPRFPRLARTGAPDEMRLTWSSLRTGYEFADLFDSEGGSSPVQQVRSMWSARTAQTFGAAQALPIHTRVHKPLLLDAALGWRYTCS